MNKFPSREFQCNFEFRPDSKMNNFSKIQAQLDDINAYLAKGDNLTVTEHENRFREFQNNSKIKPADDYDFVLKKSICNNNHLPRSVLTDKICDFYR